LGSARSAHFIGFFRVCCDVMHYRGTTPVLFPYLTLRISVRSWFSASFMMKSSMNDDLTVHFPLLWFQAPASSPSPEFTCRPPRVSKALRSLLSRHSGNSPPSQFERASTKVRSRFRNLSKGKPVPPSHQSPPKTGQIARPSMRPLFPFSSFIFPTFVFCSCYLFPPHKVSGEPHLLYRRSCLTGSSVLSPPDFLQVRNESL